MAPHRPLAVVTGASRGLGLALAHALARKGYSLVLDARTPEPLARAARDLHRTVPDADIVALAGDIADPGHRQALARAVGDRPVAALVNNAGILGPSPRPALLDFPLDALGEVFRVNVTAQLGLIQALRTALLPGAAILNVTSDAALEPYEGWGGYGASKAALEHLSAVLAAENAVWRVYRVDPGDMRTAMHQDAFPGEDIGDRPEPAASVPGLVALIESSLPSGRYAAREVLQATTGATAAAGAAREVA